MSESYAGKINRKLLKKRPPKKPPLLKKPTLLLSLPKASLSLTKLISLNNSKTYRCPEENSSGHFYFAKFILHFLQSKLDISVYIWYAVNAKLT